MPANALLIRLLACGTVGAIGAGTAPVSAQSSKPAAKPRNTGKPTPPEKPKGLDFQGGQKPEQRPGEAWAVVVGIGYTGDNHLRYTLPDAQKFRTFLKTPDDHTLFLSDTPDTPPDRRATKENILNAVRTLAARTKPQDKFWFYFSGHGKYLQADDASYLIPADVTSLSARTGLSVTEVRSLIADPARCPARARLIVLDACESGSSRLWRQVTPDSGGYKPLDGVVTLAAARPDRSAFETSRSPVGGGLFTYYLCAGLAGAAAEPGKPVVTLYGLREYVTREVNAMCSRIGQTPQEPVFLAKDLPEPEWKRVVVSSVNPSGLETLKPTEAQAIATTDIEQRPPLEGGVIVVLSTASTGTSPSTLGNLKAGLATAKVPLLAEENAGSFLDVLRDPSRAGEAGQQAERLNARLLLRVTVTATSEQRSRDAHVGRVQMQADVVDVRGKILNSVTTGVVNRPGLNPLSAMNNAVTEATKQLLQGASGSPGLLGTLQTYMKINP